MPENLDPAQLKHMSKDELVNYFKTEMTKMRRNHELQVQGMTEEYFSLKPEFFKERGSSLPLKKDKEFDILRKKIPDVISKLDDILVENEKLPVFDKNADALLSENHHLRDFLTDKKKEVKCLSSQVSDAAEKMSQHSLVEAKLLKMIGNLKCAIEDARMEASINEAVYKCVLREVTGQIKCDSEQFELASQELNDLRDRAKQQQILISETSKESDAIKCKLVETLEQIDLYKPDMSKLNQNLELAMKELRETDEERRMLLAKEKEHREQMKSVTVRVHGLSKAVSDFECRVAEDIKRNSLSIVPENLDPRIKYMSKDELVNYFENEMTKMKRNHDSQVQEMTEEYFSLKQEFFRKGGLPCHWTRSLTY